MSRCFSYPPPHGYVATIAANDALINSIKLHGETEMAAKSERKKQRKIEKTLIRQSKNEKKEHKSSNQLGKRKRSDEKAHKLGFGKDDNLERSNITEELGQPSSYQNQCASDSSENSNRRKRHATTLEIESGIQANGNVLKIRLAPQKLNDPVELMDQLSSRNTIPSVVPVPVPAASIPIEQKCSTSGRKRSRSTEEEAIDHHYGSTSLDKEMKLVSLLYKDLVSGFAPLQLYETDDSWLFERKSTKSLSEKCKPIRDIPVSISNSGSNLWPKASYLSEVELYALPYTVPF